MYSPARFFGVVLAAVVAVFVLGNLSDSSSQVPAPTASASAPTTTMSPSSSTEVSALEATPPPPSSPAPMPSGGLEPPPDAATPALTSADAAAAFVAAWARPDLDVAQWSALVRPLATVDLWSSGLSKTDPASTPEVTVAGEPREVQLDETSVVFDVPTTGVWVRVSLELPDGTWLVSAVEPAT